MDKFGPYILASVIVMCGTFAYKRDSLTVRSKDINLQIKSSCDDIKIAIDKSSNNLFTQMNTIFLRLESRIGEVEKKSIV